MSWFKNKSCFCMGAGEHYGNCPHSPTLEKRLEEAEDKAKHFAILSMHVDTLNKELSEALAKHKKAKNERDKFEEELTRIKTDGYVNLAAWKRTVDERDAALAKAEEWKEAHMHSQGYVDAYKAKVEAAEKAANDWEKTARNACGGGARVGNELIDLRKRIETLASNWKKWCQGGEKYAEDLLDLLKPIKKETAWELLLRLERETYSTLLSHSATETMAKLRKALEEDNEKAK